MFNSEMLSINFILKDIYIYYFIKQLKQYKLNGGTGRK